MFTIEVNPASSLALLCGVIFLVLLLVPARLLHLKSLQKYCAFHLWLARQGKWLGLLTASCFWFHGALILPRRQWSAAAILLAVCLGIFALLSVISNSWSYAHIKYWKHLNMLVWLAVPLLGIYAVMARQEVGGGLTVLVCLLLAMCAVAGMSGLFEPQPGYFARHRVWLMAVGLGFGLVVAGLW